MWAKLEKFLKKIGVDADQWVWRESDTMPCYAVRRKVTHHFNTHDKIVEYIKLCLKWEGMKHGFVVFSVTERDDSHYKLWLEAVFEFPGATVIRTNSRLHGGYACWMICIPEEPKVGEESFVVAME